MKKQEGEFNSHEILRQELEAALDQFHVMGYTKYRNLNAFEAKLEEKVKNEDEKERWRREMDVSTPFKEDQKDKKAA